MQAAASPERARFLTALPVYNEAKYVDDVLNQVHKYSPDMLVVDDGSTDGTAEILARRSDVEVLRHPRNRGYGAALASAFQYALERDYETLVTIDCDGQHQPCRIPAFVAAAADADIVSGSRYLTAFAGDSAPPPERLHINQELSREIERRLGLKLTDAFCGFKAYRRHALRQLEITETGYAMPLEVWAQAAYAGLNVIELPVPLIYLDLSRSFGGALDDAQTRLQHYYATLDRCIARVEARHGRALCGHSCGEAAE